MFALSRPLQAGAFNYTLNRDSDEDWYLRSENAYRAEVPLYTSMLTQAMDYDRILAGSRSHQTGVNGENNSVRLSIQGAGWSAISASRRGPALRPKPASNRTLVIRRRQVEAYPNLMSDAMCKLRQDRIEF